MSFLSRHKYLLSDIGLVYAAAVWGSTFFLVKDSLNFINPVTLVGYRFLLAALILGGVLAALKKNIFSHFKEGFILGIFIWLLYIPQTVGLLYTTAANSGFITGLFVAFVPLLSFILFRRVPSIARIIAVLLSVVGLYLLTGGLKTLNIGDLLTLITAMAYAFHILVAGVYLNRKIDPYIVTFQQFLIAGVLSIISALIFGQSLSVQTAGSLWVIIFLAVFPTLIAFAIQMIAQQYTAPVKVAIIFALEPVFAAIFAWTLGGETFKLVNAVGGLFIVSAMIVSELPLMPNKD